MPDYTARITVSTDPETFTFASLSPLEGRTISNPLSTTNKPAIFVQEEDGDRRFRVSAVNSSGGYWVSFSLDASDFGGDLPVTAIAYIRTFDLVSTVSNAKSSTVSRVRRLLQITSSNELLTDDEISERIDDATVIYSKHNPKIGRYEIIGNSEYEEALPSDWVKYFSVIQKVEYPAGEQETDYHNDNLIEVVYVDTTSRTIDSASSGASSVTASTIAQAGFFKDGEIITIGDDDASETNWVSSDGIASTGVIAVKNTLSNTYDSNPYIKKLDHFKFVDDSPASDDYYVLEYTLPHTHTDSSDTIPDNDYEIFTWICASLCAYSISAEFGKGTSSGFDADSVNLLTNAEHWRNIAKDYEKRYRDHLGINETGLKAAFAISHEDSWFAHKRAWTLH